MDPTRSDRHGVVLFNISRETRGKFRCEVSTEAPYFFTAVEAVEVAVSAVPRGPHISGTRSSYSIEEVISATCSTSHSLPAPDITWYVNGDNIDPRHVTVRNLHENKTHHGLIDSLSSLQMSNLREYCKVSTIYYNYKLHTTKSHI